MTLGIQTTLRKTGRRYILDIENNVSGYRDSVGKDFCRSAANEDKNPSIHASRRRLHHHGANLQGYEAVNPSGVFKIDERLW